MAKIQSMNRWGCAALLSGVLAIGASLPLEAADRGVSWRQISDRSLSPLGRRLMRGNKRAWTHAESDEFIFHVADGRALGRVAREAEWCFAEIGRWLELPAPDQPIRLFAVDTVSAWEHVMQATPHGSGGVAAHVGGEIFLRRAPEEAPRYVDLAHELVHARLYLAYGGRIPLWLDEGLAEYVGWRVASDYYRQHRELHLYRDPVSVGEDEWLPWSEFFGRSTYPADPEQNRVFYRQSYQVVRFLVERLGEDRLGAFVRNVVETDGPVERVLMDDWGWDAVDWGLALEPVGFQPIFER